MRLIDHVLVTTEQMRAIEARLFDAGMPVAALMEKVATSITNRIQALYPPDQGRRVGVLVGPGHNGGDALVVARELHFRGYQVGVWCPFEQLKELTTAHFNYLKSLKVPVVQEIAELGSPDFWVDGLFGVGLDRLLEGPVTGGIEWVNQSDRPVVSIDLPSGLHTDTGAVLGTAIRAQTTLCLGLWKQGLLQDPALDYVGEVELIDFDIPWVDIETVIGDSPSLRRLTQREALAALPWPTSLATHKYRRGHAFLIAGSAQYRGAALLAALGARASGVGMLSIAVPSCLVEWISAQVPDAIIWECPETPRGAIEYLPDDINLDAYDAIACGPGLSLGAEDMIKTVLKAKRPTVFDADALNLIARRGTVPSLRSRSALTVLTPHPGEFERLFPDMVETGAPAYSLARKAAEVANAVVLLKGARVAIAYPRGSTWLNPESTPALARGGSGDVLTGLLGGLMASAAAQQQSVEAVIKTAVWWHAHAARWAERDRTQFGVDAYTLSQSLIPSLGQMQVRGSGR